MQICNCIVQYNVSEKFSVYKLINSFNFQTQLIYPLENRRFGFWGERRRGS